MLGYLTQESIAIKNKDGLSINVKNFRNRKKFDPDFIYQKQVSSPDNVRLDNLSIDLYSNMFKLSGVIDTNDKDVFSIQSGDNVFFADGDLI